MNNEKQKNTERNEIVLKREEDGKGKKGIEFDLKMWIAGINGCSAVRASNVFQFSPDILAPNVASLEILQKAVNAFFIRKSGAVL